MFSTMMRVLIYNLKNKGSIPLLATHTLPGWSCMSVTEGNHLEVVAADQTLPPSLSLSFSLSLSYLAIGYWPTGANHLPSLPNLFQHLPWRSPDQTCSLLVNFRLLSKRMVGTALAGTPRAGQALSKVVPFGPNAIPNHVCLVVQATLLSCATLN